MKENLYHKNKKYKGKAISLFAGCGGDSLGLEMAGFKVVGFVEFWDKAIQTHKLNFPKAEFIGEKWKGDITQIPDKEFLRFKEKIDIIFAGFPCQGFSHAGKKEPNDSRNKLFWEFIRIVDIIKPKWIIGENVAGILYRKTDDGKTNVSDVIVQAFEKIGYNMNKPTVLKTEEYNVPQKRRRVFFVGSKLKKTFKFPNPEKKRMSIRKIIEADLTDATQFTLKLKGIPDSKIYKIQDGIVVRGKPHPYLLRKLKEKNISFKKRISPFHAEIVDIDFPTKTIHCGYSFQPRLFVLLKNKKGKFIRPFNTRELAQIQGFPKNYKFFGKKEDIIKQIGNAVPPILVAKIVGAI